MNNPPSRRDVVGADDDDASSGRVRDRVRVSWGEFGRLLAQTGGVLLVTIALLALIEFGAGLVVGQRQTVAPRPAMSGDMVSEALAGLEVNAVPLVRDADLLWRNEPGGRRTQLVNPQTLGRTDSWTIQNNSEGFRGPERVTGDAKANVLSIVCIGDSVTFGFNVDQPDTYPRQLEDVLVRRYPGHRFEVVNAGVSGWSWLQGLRFLELRGLALRPDIVVIGHGSNDQFWPARVTDEERLHLLSGPLARAGRALARRLVDSNSFRLVERLFPPPPFTPIRTAPPASGRSPRTARVAESPSTRSRRRSATSIGSRRRTAWRCWCSTSTFSGRLRCKASGAAPKPSERPSWTRWRRCGHV
jgi:hypothetical protein